MSHDLEEERFKRKELQEGAWFCHRLDTVVGIDSEKVREGGRSTGAVTGWTEARPGNSGEEAQDLRGSHAGVFRNKPRGAWGERNSAPTHRPRPKPKKPQPWYSTWRRRVNRAGGIQAVTSQPTQRWGIFSAVPAGPRDHREGAEPGRWQPETQPHPVGFEASERGHQQGI